MYYGEIKKIDIANGLGVRVSLFVSGCRNKCPGCFNQMTWNFNYGKEFTKKTEEENQRVLAPFLEKVRATFPKKTIWCYSGYIYDIDLKPSDGRKHCEVTDRMLDCIDVLVDGPFKQELKDITLNYRGSSNQRILWLKENKPVNSID